MRRKPITDAQRNEDGSKINDGLGQADEAFGKINSLRRIRRNHLASPKGREVIAVRELYRRIGLMNAPFPAISHTATRAHFQSFASVFHVNVWLPNGRASVS